MMPRKVKDILVREEEEGFLLYNPLTDELHAVSNLGMTILEECDGSNTVDDILTTLACANPFFSYTDARTSIIDFLKEMADRKVLSLKGPL